MKKLIAITICMVCLVMLTACTISVDNTDENFNNEVANNEPVQDSSEDDFNEEADTNEVEENKPSEEITQEQPEPSKEIDSTDNGDVTIEETVLVDEAGVKITAKSLSVDFFGQELKLLVENNSGKNLTFQCNSSSINGYMVENIMSIDVANGKKANDAITFTDTSLEACGITTIADLEFSFHIFDSDSWDTYLDTDFVQLKTSIADTYEYIFDDSGNIVFDEDGIKLVVKGLSEDDSIFGPGIIIYIENNTDENITVQVQDVSINGFMVYGIFSSDVTVGKRAVDSITFMSSELEENGITEIQDVELSFHIFETDGWNTIVDTDAIQLAF